MIEILSVDLLDQHRERVKELKQLAHALGLDFGWHYLLDLTWILQQLEQVGFPEKGASLYIMDAGASTGILQWYLAEKGVQVLSVDRGSRRDLPLRFRRRYHAQGLRPQDLSSASDLLRDRWRSSASSPTRSSMAASLRRFGRDVSGLLDFHRAPGSVTFYHQDLKTLVDVPDGALDAVVAVSALEHNPPEELPQVAAELMRVLRPGGLLAATLGAAKQDWFHTPSKGWNYSEASLRRYFDLPVERDGPSNYEQHDNLLARLVNCAELRDNLAAFYSLSGDNGMPWGKWDPQYQPVGVSKRAG